MKTHTSISVETELLKRYREKCKEKPLSIWVEEKLRDELLKERTIEDEFFELQAELRRKEEAIRNMKYEEDMIRKRIADIEAKQREYVEEQRRIALEKKKAFAARIQKDKQWLVSQMKKGRLRDEEEKKKFVEKRAKELGITVEEYIELVLTPAEMQVEAEAEADKVLAVHIQ